MMMIVLKCVSECIKWLLLVCIAPITIIGQIVYVYKCKPVQTNGANETSKSATNQYTGTPHQLIAGQCWPGKLKNM